MLMVVILMNLNKYIVIEMMKSDKLINYNAFYKNDLIFMLQILREEYKKMDLKLNMLGR